MRIYELIDDDTKRKLNAAVHRPKPTRPIKQKKSKEKLSDADLRYLMGTNRDRYHKVSGRVKRK